MVVFPTLSIPSMAMNNILFDFGNELGSWVRHVLIVQQEIAQGIISILGKPNSNISRGDEGIEIVAINDQKRAICDGGSVKVFGDSERFSQSSRSTRELPNIAPLSVRFHTSNACKRLN